MADITSILWFIVIGGLAGWLASLLITGRGFGLFGNIAIGIIGAVIGGWLFGGTGGGISMFVVAFLGAIILLAIVMLIRRIDR